MPARNPANAYQAQAVQTANGPRLLIMLCDRLSVDVSRAEAAMIAGDLKATNESLQHAQQIVRVLRTSLDPDGFVGGHELMSVYVFLEGHLVKANLEKSLEKVRECAGLIELIRDAWNRAVTQSEREDDRTHVG